LPPIETPEVPNPPALIEGDKRCSLQKTTILAPELVNAVQATMKKHHSLAHIRRVLWDRHRNGSRSDGAIENLGMIREPAGRGN
jgi:hypothetical protein